jgi:thioredoxin reductase
LKSLAEQWLEDSDLLIAQKFIPTEYDWRVGVLGGQPLFAVHYLMAKKHWQIVNHKANGKPDQGGIKTFTLKEAPPHVVETAVKAARCIGDGLYGVDLKETKDGVFVIETESNSGGRRARQAHHVVMAIGYYDHPVMIRVPGEDLPHVRHFYGEAHPHYRQRVVVVGGGNSAAESALEMYRAGAHVTIVHRAPTLKPTIKYWVRPDIENRIKEGSIAAHFSAIVREIRPGSIVIAPCRGFSSALPDDVAVPADGSEDFEAPARPALAGELEIPADAVYLLTGYRTDKELLRHAGVLLNERDAPVHDPETFETNVSGLFVAGGAIAGVDTGTIFIENGRFHGTKIVEEIARRLQA